VLPGAYAVPAAAIVTVGGLLACFAGYRLFRLVLGLYGFLIGAFVSTSATGAQDPWTLTLAIVVGGLVGALLMIAAYFVGVGLVGAGLAALGLNLVWRAGLGGEPPTLVLVIVAVLGALGALSVARHVVIIGTALAGAWSLIVGGMALAGHASALEAASGGAVWVFYPLDAGMPTRWVIPGWIALSVAGVAVQLATTGRTGRRKVAAKPKG
jgi:hypothetical protein